MSPALLWALTADTGRTLPAITYATTARAPADQHAEVAAARMTLCTLFRNDRRVESTICYDVLATAEHHAKQLGMEVAEFREALLMYAAPMSWAFAVYFGAGRSPAH